ncbi:fasciclin domain-containing protein [Costertonia aggregata]|uniref:Fasciclin domain-containing protein n=1 Tax=Costertonia aggregata TaxID=343403 RepID=A0A7H9ANC1_9FLAO|nr:fasciclin domain-containing protein [Costertonia aggregata]QLG44927.1 fasciclin domain-containing protein [Costertonia aggregata]
MNSFLKNRFKSITAGMLTTALVVSCGKNDDEPPVLPDENIAETIFQILDKSDSLTVLSALIKETDRKTGGALEASLKTDGSFTLFAPINDSDSPLLINLDSEGNLVIPDEDAELWDNILKYHIVSTKAIKASDLNDGEEFTTVLGETLSVNRSGGTFLEDATQTKSKIVKTDIVAKNGIIHYIDKVLTPQIVLDAIDSKQSNGVEEILAADPELSSFLAAIKAAGLEDVYFKNPGVISKGSDRTAKFDLATIFAPNNTAFQSLFDELGDDYNGLDDFDTDEEKTLLRDALRFHTAPDSRRMRVSFTQAEEQLNTLLGEQLGDLDEDITVAVQGADIQIRDSKSAGFIVNGDKEAGNNIIHTINIVLRHKAFYDGFEADARAGDTRNMPTVFKTYPSLSILLEAIEKTALSFEYPRNNFTEPPLNISTYFAPNNDAFEELFNYLGDTYSSLDDFDTPEKLEVLKDILLHQHSSSYLCKERLEEEGRSANVFTRLINPQVPKFPDNERFQVKTTGDAANPVIKLEDYLGREANFNQFNIKVAPTLPACAEGQTGLSGATSLIHIIDKVMMKSEFRTRLNP